MLPLPDQAPTPDRGPPPSRQLAALARIEELAAEVGCSRWTMLRRLKRLLKRHGGDWLLRPGEGRVYAVNRDRLRAAHPHLFTPRLSSQKAVDDLLQAQREDRKGQKAMGARVRDLEAKVSTMSAQLSQLMRDVSNGHASISEQLGALFAALK